MSGVVNDFKVQYEHLICKAENLYHQLQERYKGCYNSYDFFDSLFHREKSCLIEFMSKEDFEHPITDQEIEFNACKCLKCISGYSVDKTFCDGSRKNDGVLQLTEWYKGHCEGRFYYMPKHLFKSMKVLYGLRTQIEVISELYSSICIFPSNRKSLNESIESFMAQLKSAETVIMSEINWDFFLEN